MLMTQYTFTLPADYPMRAIRERIAARGPQFDTLPGLGWKAFLMRERGLGGAPDHQYAPLYLWPSPEAAAHFFTGPLFGAVSAAFGRPVVDTALLLRLRQDAPTRRPRWCTSGRHALHSLAELPDHLAAFDNGETLGRHSAWLTLDASQWLLSCHQLWWGEPPPAGAETQLFEVAHFSKPT